MAGQIENTDEMLKFLPQHWVKDASTNNYNFIFSFAYLAFIYQDEQDTLENNIFISTSSGTYLDRKGLLYGINRNGLDDTQYRNKIIADNASKLGGGIVESIASSVASLANVTESDVTITDYSSKASIFDIAIAIDEDFDSVDIDNLTETVNSVKAAGTYYRNLSLASKDNIFRCDISTGDGIDHCL